MAAAGHDHPVDAERVAAARAGVLSVSEAGRLAGLLGMLADPVRSRILFALVTAGELCVGDLVKILRVPQPTASRHLAYLRRTGLVTIRKSGLWNFYRLASAKSSFHRNLLECLRDCFRSVPEITRDTGAAAKLRRAGGCCPR